MAALGHVGEEHPELTVANLAERATVLARDPDRLGPLLGNAALIDDEHAVGRIQARGQVSLQSSDHRRGLPGGLGQQPLQRPWRRALDGLSDVLGIAPIRLLHEQAAHVLLTAPLHLLAPEQGSELPMKSGERGRHAIKLPGIHRRFLLPTASHRSPRQSTPKSVVVVLERIT